MLGENGVAVANVAVGIAFLAGLGSIGSPCVLPLVPTYLAYLGGVSGDGSRRRTVVIHGALFVAGFSLVFVLFGLSATAVGRLLLLHQRLLNRLSGLVVVALGLNVAGILPLPWLERDWRPAWRRPAQGVSASQSFLLGLSFSAGWTACVGPILASILALAAQTRHWQEGAILLVAYSLGLGVPFLAMAAFVGQLQPFLHRTRRLLPLIQRLSGILLVALGLMLFLGIFSRLSAMFS